MASGQLSVNQSMSVLVADDQVLVRAGAEALINATPGFRCIGSVEDGQRCLAACARQQPDILLLDVQMPGPDGLQVAQSVRRQHPGVRIVILTSRVDSALARRALSEGAAGFVSKDFVLDELGLALRTVAAGRQYLSPDVALAAVHAPEPPAGLTPRQVDVLRGIATGRSNKQIARDLGVSVKTVEYHRSELIQRLDLHDVASLTRYALASGLVV